MSDQLTYISACKVSDSIFNSTENNWTVSMTTEQTASTDGRPWDVGERSGKNNQPTDKNFHSLNDCVW